MSLIQNPQCKWATIKWSERILKVIDPNFKYVFTEYNTSTTINFSDGTFVVKNDFNKNSLVYNTPAQKEKNDQNIQAFVQYWEQHKNDPEVIKLIKDINWNPVKYRVATNYRDDYCQWRNNDCNE
jgi:hypothetical protein